MQLVTRLNDEGFGVKLEHDAKETSRESHGFVVLKMAGRELARSDDFQHNRNFHSMAAKADVLVAAAMTTMADCDLA
eukprot:CAMPEP_0183333170 /NCGR_PEP_ID=MMETSP0164_2-20130417/2123_1 /TAXON_ID=221442 /ORGANISM="Coccolithus pelagicus ssp braarudi, Strain PLY182g" /LENGTH=76 /DNA_ID=CAMNT_0025502023 /DNA_START=313 /DNA_END=543 /DNA_ORIENTATION=-